MNITKAKKKVVAHSIQTRHRIDITLGLWQLKQKEIYNVRDGSSHRLDWILKPITLDRIIFKKIYIYIYDESNDKFSGKIAFLKENGH